MLERSPSGRVGAILVAAAVACAGRTAHAQDHATEDAPVEPGPLLFEIDMTLGVRWLAERDGSAAVTTVRSAIDLGVQWAPRRAATGRSYGIGMEVAVANHQYATGDGGPKSLVELGLVGMARFPWSRKTTVDVRGSALKAVHQGDDDAPPSVLARAGAAARYHPAAGSHSYFSAGVETEVFTRRASREDDGVGVGWGLFGVARAEGPAALLPAGLIAVGSLLVLQSL